MRVSFRALPPVFRADTGFEHVYETDDGRLYRVAGAIHAVFERSAYQGVGSGAAAGGDAGVAGGVTYYIGPPGGLGDGVGTEALAEPTGARASNPVLARPATRMAGLTSASAVRLAERLDLFPASGAESGGDQTSEAVTPAERRPSGWVVSTVSHEPTRVRRLRTIAMRAGD